MINYISFHSYARILDLFNKIDCAVYYELNSTERYNGADKNYELESLISMKNSSISLHSQRVSFPNYSSH